MIDQMINYVWRCQCGKQVTADPTGNPSSKYYSIERKEVYCSVECGLKAYQSTGDKL